MTEVRFLVGDGDLQLPELRYPISSRTAATRLQENNVGFPIE
jgi:hypothetical protein